jgi:NADH-quinone oxidoreductase subunit D
MELGAFTPFLYLMQAREYLYELIEDVTGARITTCYTRIGGLRDDLPEGFDIKAREAFLKTRNLLKDVDKLLTDNRIFIDRMKGIGIISKEDAISYGITGPFLRSTGVPYDVRKAQPYLIYNELDFDIPIGTNGDNYDRYLVRMEEMEQSMKIVEQALKKIPDGPINVDDRRYVLPLKDEVYNTIEGLMNHFKLIIEGIKVPKGEVYFPVEGANGELGFYIVSDGSSKPYKLRVRPPCFPIMAAFSNLIEGLMVADIVPTFGSVNMIGGELDR